jgi:hypothetical protein
MAVLTKMPEMAIVDGFKGTLDFYVHKGQVVVRKWPRYQPRVPTADEKANQDLFSYAMKAWRTLPLYLQRQYRTMAVSTKFRPQDIYIRLYIQGLNE